MILVVFSDSIGAGQHVSLTQGWVHRAAASMPDVETVNVSISGDTTRTALLRMAHDVPPCDVLVVQFGLNDCNRWTSEHGHNRVSEDAFVANLTEIAERAGDARVVFLTNHRTAKDPEYDLRALRYNALVREAAMYVKAMVVEMEYESVPLLDGIHPSVIGHHRYAEVMLPVLRAAMPAEQEMAG